MCRTVTATERPLASHDVIERDDAKALDSIVHEIVPAGREIGDVWLRYRVALLYKFNYLRKHVRRDLDSIEAYEMIDLRL